MNQVIPRCLGLITADMVADAIRSYTQESSSRIGMIIGTFAAVPYVHLQLEARRRMYPEVPLLVHDDSSKQQERLRKLCAEYGADFLTTEERLPSHNGDLSCFSRGLQWAAEHGIEFLLKLSRRWVWKEDFRPSLLASFETGAPTVTYHTRTYGFGFRSECVAMKVSEWNTPSIRSQIASKIAERVPGVFVERYIHVLAMEIAKRAKWSGPNKTGDRTGYAPWPFMGDDRHSRHPSRMWHNSESAEDYAALAREWGLTYTAQDFRDPNMGEGAVPAAKKSCCGGGKGATPLQSIGNAVKAAGRVVAAVVSGDEVTVTEDVRQSRLAVCRTCEHLRHARVDYCNLCTCWLRAKRLLATEQCPAGKW